MSNKEFRALLDMLMCHDNDFSTYMLTLNLYAQRRSIELGYADWIDAYHRYEE